MLYNKPQLVGENMNKRTKKIIVNSLTLSRVVGTLLLPILFNLLSAPAFLITISILYCTDLLDGLFAKRIFKVKTIGGAILDMTADKLLGFGVLIILSGMYPIMSIPLILELLIASVNIIGGTKGNNNKSSEIGRIKTVIVGLSLCSLLLLGLSNEIIECINNIKIIDFIKFVQKNKNSIKDVATTATLVSEGIVLTDYSLKAFKKNEKKVTLEELKELKKQLLSNLKEKSFYTDKLFNEKYNDITEDLSLKDKLFPDKETEKEIKKLVLNYNNVKKVKK